MVILEMNWHVIIYSIFKIQETAKDGGSPSSRAVFLNAGNILELPGCLGLSPYIRKSTGQARVILCSTHLAD